MKKYTKAMLISLLAVLLCIGGYHGYCSFRSQKQLEELVTTLTYEPHDIYINYVYTSQEESSDQAHVNRFVSFTLAGPEQVGEIDELLTQLTYKGYFPKWQFRKKVTPWQDSYFITILKPSGTIENEDDVLFDLMMMEDITIFHGDPYLFCGEFGNTETLYQAIRALSLEEKDQTSTAK